MAYQLRLSPFTFCFVSYALSPLSSILSPSHPTQPYFRNVVAKCEDQALQWQVTVAAKQVVLATWAIITCTKVLVPCIDSPLCQDQMIEAHKMVAAAVEKIVLTAQVRTMLPYM